MVAREDARPSQIDSDGHDLGGAGLWRAVVNAKPGLQGELISSTGEELS